jgi:hypothetical protein
MKISKESPPTRFQYENWAEIAAAGHDSPGIWVTPEREYPHSIYGALTRGKNSTFPLGDWEFRTSGTRYDIADGKRYCTIHFKYVGPQRESTT